MTSVSHDAFTTAKTADPFAGRQAPFNLEAEQAVLSAMLQSGEAVLRAAETLQDWMFYKEGHRRLFRAMADIARRNEAVDAVTLQNEMVRKGEIDAVGGIDYVAYLLDVVPSAANLDYHANIVRDKAVLRRIIEVSTENIQEAYAGRDLPLEILDRAESRLFSVAEYRSTKGFVRIKNLLWPAMERIESLQGGGQVVTGVATGFRDLDEKTAGFQRSDLIIVAARPSMGKTAFCLNVAQHAAIEAKVPVAIFSLEMSTESLIQRLLTSEARVDGHRVRTGSFRPVDYTMLAQAAGILAQAPIYIDDSPALTPLELRSKARRIKAEADVGMVIVDYLQLMRSPEDNENRVLEISAISRALKALAKELSIPVVALSQLSRAPEQRGGEHRRPQLSDLRESGAIEQDADVVLFIYRPEVYATDEIERDKLRGQAELIIGKQRNGPTGTVKLHFHSSYTRFESFSGRPDESSAGDGYE